MRSKLSLTALQLTVACALSLVAACDQSTAELVDDVRQDGGVATLPDFDDLGPHRGVIITPDVIITPPQPDASALEPDASEPEPDASEPEPDASEPEPDASEPEPDASAPDSDCGDGVVDGDEVCDAATQGCCNSTCSGAIGRGATCRSAAGLCDAAETCDGTSYDCPSDGFAPSTQVCRSADAADLCDAPELCTGGSATCPSADVRIAEGQPCNAGRGACRSDVCCPGATLNDGTGACGFDEGDNIAFVTSISFDGALGGASGADTRCNNLAAAANLAGTYHAWLSYGTVGAAPINAFTRVSTGPYFRVDGLEVSPNLDSILAGVPLTNPINRTELNDTRVTPVWTGTTGGGTYSGNVCASWTSNSSTPIGTAGGSGQTGALWSASTTPTCNNTSALYCMQDDCPGAANVDFMSDPDHCGSCDNACPAQLSCIHGTCGAYVFVTSTTTAGTLVGGLAGGDAICAGRAAAMNLPQTFHAWLSATGVNARDRIVDAPYYRMDNQLIADNLAALLDAANKPLVNPINIDERGGASSAVEVDRHLRGRHAGVHRAGERSEFDALLERLERRQSRLAGYVRQSAGDQRAVDARRRQPAVHQLAAALLLPGRAQLMGVQDFTLPPELEALLQQVCAERGVAPRRHDELRSMLLRFPGSWAACCKGKCDPCVDDQAAIANEVLARWAPREPPYLKD